MKVNLNFGHDLKNVEVEVTPETYIKLRRELAMSDVFGYNLNLEKVETLTGCKVFAYEVTGPLRFSTTDQFTTWDSTEDYLEYNSQLEDFIVVEREDLDLYAGDRLPYVLCIFPGIRWAEDGRPYSRTLVTSVKKLSEEELKDVKEYITGQFSDGWGEGVEQRSFAGWDEYITETVYDEEDEEEYEVEECYRYESFVHFWNSDDFELTVKEIED
jgi:hypothetical protein